jgi:hypothetical protein
MTDRGTILSDTRAAGLDGVAIGDRVEIEGSGPAFVTGLAAGHVELARLSPVPPVVGAAVRAAGPLQIPVGDALLGRSIDVLGRPLTDAGPVHRIFFTSPQIRPDPRFERLPLGLWVYDLKQAFTVGSNVLATGDSPAILHHMLRHHARSGRVAIHAVLTPQAKVDAGEGQIVVWPGSEPTPAATWLVPWAAMAIADHAREQGRDAVVVLDSLDRWRALADAFSSWGSWQTHLGRFLGHTGSTTRGSVSLIAAASPALAPSIEARFEGAIDFERALAGVPVRTGGTFVKPAIKIRPVSKVGRAMGLLAEFEPSPEALRLREALKFRPGMSVDHVEQLAAFMAVCELVPDPVAGFIDALIPRLPSATLAEVRRRKEYRDEDHAAILAVARQVILDTGRR